MDQYNKTSPAPKTVDTDHKTQLKLTKRELESKIYDLENQLKQHDYLITRLRKDLERMREGINAVASRTTKNG